MIMISDHASGAGPSAMVHEPLKFHSVTKSWGDRSVLSAASYSFQGGDFWVMSGRSGQGKTTFLNLIAGYIEPDAGSIEVSGTVGYLLQDDVLLSGLTAIENVEVAIAASAVSATDAELGQTCLERVGLAGRSSVPVEYLSGGERQRVQFAMLLAQQHDVVLLDEPTSSLDSSTRGEMADLIRNIFAKPLCLVVSHDEQLRSEIVGARGLQLVGGQLVEI